MGIDMLQRLNPLFRSSIPIDPDPEKVNSFRSESRPVMSCYIPVHPVNYIESPLFF